MCKSGTACEAVNVQVCTWIGNRHRNRLWGGKNPKSRRSLQEKKPKHLLPAVRVFQVRQYQRIGKQGRGNGRRIQQEHRSSQRRKKKKSSLSETVIDIETVNAAAETDGGVEEEFDVDATLRQLEEENAADDDGYRAKRHKTKSAAPKKSSVLRIYTDGSALGNGRDDATAGVGVWFGSNDASRNVSEPLSGPVKRTNVRS
ncbi:hypothetical protein BDZ91DRAFT_112162 [Kalaharituber pfeilii]|nr:hypothetical protein BDZ91DRAFT_112162 [Kalaharituber pfeilii]